MNPAVTNNKRAILKKKLSQVGSFIANAPQNAYENLKATINTAQANKAGKSALSQANIIKTARAYDDAPNFNEKGPTDAMKMRVAADNIINPLGKKRKPGLNSFRLRYPQGLVGVAPARRGFRPAPAPAKAGGRPVPAWRGK